MYFRVAVCGPALYYFDNDFSSRLIEWLELLKMLGVEKVILYETTVHPNISKTLLYYELQGFVTTISFRYPPPYVDYGPVRRYYIACMIGVNVINNFLYL